MPRNKRKESVTAAELGFTGNPVCPTCKGKKTTKIEGKTKVCQTCNSTGTPVARRPKPVLPTHLL